jgi:hypothetical protein
MNFYTLFTDGYRKLIQAKAAEVHFRLIHDIPSQLLQILVANSA